MKRTIMMTRIIRRIVMLGKVHRFELRSLDWPWPSNPCCFGISLLFPFSDYPCFFVCVCVCVCVCVFFFPFCSRVFFQRCAPAEWNLRETCRFSHRFWREILVTFSLAHPNPGKRSTENFTKISRQNSGIRTPLAEKNWEKNSLLHFCRVAALRFSMLFFLKGKKTRVGGSGECTEIAHFLRLPLQISTTGQKSQRFPAHSLDLIKSLICTNTACKSTCLYNVPRLHTVEILERDWKLQASHPPSPFLCLCWILMSILNVSSEIRVFKRDWKVQARCFFKIRALPWGSSDLIFKIRSYFLDPILFRTSLQARK